MNPYTDLDFWQFLDLYWHRFFPVLFGGVEAASDEIQIGMLVLISIAAGAIGSFLMLKKMVMLANSLSHTVLLGIVTAFILLGPQKMQAGGEFGHFDLTILMIASIISAVVTTVLTQALTRWGKVQEDAGIGLVFTTLFALGILLVTLFTRNVHLGLEVIMGNIDLVEKKDLPIAFWQAALSLGFIGLFFKELKASCFDPIFAKLLGMRPGAIEFILLLFTATLAVIAFRAVGVLLFLAFLTGPTLLARVFAYRIKTIMIISILLGIVVSFVGVALARHIFTIYNIPLSTGGLVVTLVLIAYLFSLVFGLFCQKLGLFAPKASR